MPHLKKEFINDFNEILNNEDKINDIQTKFENRIYKKSIFKYNFIKNITLIKNNLILLSKLDDIETYEPNVSDKYENLYDNYFQNLKTNNLELLVIDEIDQKDSNFIVRYKKNGDYKYVNIDINNDLKKLFQKINLMAKIVLLFLSLIQKNLYKIKRSKFFEWHYSNVR